MNAECGVQVVALQAWVERVEVQGGEAMRGADGVAAICGPGYKPAGAGGEVS